MTQPDDVTDVPVERDRALCRSLLDDYRACLELVREAEMAGDYATLHERSRDLGRLEARLAGLLPSDGSAAARADGASPRAGRFTTALRRAFAKPEPRRAAPSHMTPLAD
ncbi:hypothetical protein [Marinivivus vitaminiproducens]|uniref:hypothetical protein n=1 Tax=Marinivivus vitaminiproducens TaxID=3035935 RepID=UPI00279A79F0|nr:hypothetical protein P4R82_22760 [Geminicoccaceae bacterium SCSIO 64248]